MGVTKAETVAALKDKGIKEVEDLHEFDKYNLEAVFDAFRKLPRKVE